MEVAMPVTGNTVDCYEDMFKEITRKLYGEDGLSDLTPNDRIPSSQERCLTPVDYEPDPPLLKSDDHLTAFGLAALMQNGFPSNGIFTTTFPQHKPNQGFEEKWIISDDELQWTRSKIASYNPVQKLFRCVECDCVGYLPRVAEHWLGTHSNLRTFRCPQCPYESAWARCVRLHLTRQHNISTEETTDVLLKNNPVLHEITRYLQRLKSRLDVGGGKSSSSHLGEDYHTSSSISTATSASVSGVRAPNTANSQGPICSESTNISTASKRYSCSFCPYATDRRDLFTRHENIHREEKPFQCYVCQKQFNRADHVKKHFLRMHREHPYDLNRIRRHPPKNASGMSFYHRYNSNDLPNRSSEPTSNDIVALGNSLSIPNGLGNITKNMNGKQFGNLDTKCGTNMKACLIGKSMSKKKGDKRFSCCYCSWTGVDNWCLKRHMNTHLKPFVCGLCDYKAARSERLATHVLKVHNKRACGKCSFLADDPAQLTIHQQDHHPLDQRNRSTNSLRSSYNANGGTNSAVTASTLTNATANTTNSCIPALSHTQNVGKSYEISSDPPPSVHHGSRLLSSDSTKSWKQHAPKQHGAARLFNYMEASDSSEPESDSKGPEETSRIGSTHRIQSDFPEAGDVAIHLRSVKEAEKEEVELPLFVCKSCGCEFEDDASLETHKFVKCHMSTSPAKTEDAKENVNPKMKYQCQICAEMFYTQFSVMFHMSTHSMLYLQHLSNGCIQEKENHKRSRKQTKPKKVVSSGLGFENRDEVQNGGGSLRKRLCEKYMMQFLLRRKFSCMLCRSPKLSQFRSKSKLILHQFWRHGRNSFQCEHCSLHFRHRYQVVLHSSITHVTKYQNKSQCDSKEQQMPATKTVTGHDNSTVPTCQDLSHNYANHSYVTTVPDISNTSTPVHKLGVSFLDHTFLHSNANLNGHMPIIIPTFPPC